MEIAHRRDEADGLPVAPVRVENDAKFGNDANDVHYLVEAGSRASARVVAVITSQSGINAGARDANASRCRATVSSSPRTTGPVNASRAPTSAQWSRADWTRGTT